jgi:hypothetical protein
MISFESEKVLSLHIKKNQSTNLPAQHTPYYINIYTVHNYVYETLEMHFTLCTVHPKE